MTSLPLSFQPNGRLASPSGSPRVEALGPCGAVSRGQASKPGSEMAVLAQQNETQVKDLGLSILWHYTTLDNFGCFL